MSVYGLRFFESLVMVTAVRPIVRIHPALSALLSGLDREVRSLFVLLLRFDQSSSYLPPPFLHGAFLHPSYVEPIIFCVTTQLFAMRSWCLPLQQVSSIVMTIAIQFRHFILPLFSFTHNPICCPTPHIISLFLAYPQYQCPCGSCSISLAPESFTAFHRTPAANAGRNPFPCCCNVRPGDNCPAPSCKVGGVSHQSLSLHEKQAAPYFVKIFHIEKTKYKMMSY